MVTHTGDNPQVTHGSGLHTVELGVILLEPDQWSLRFSQNFAHKSITSKVSQRIAGHSLCKSVALDLGMDTLGLA